MYATTRGGTGDKLYLSPMAASMPQTPGAKAHNGHRAQRAPRHEAGRDELHLDAVLPCRDGHERERAAKGTLRLDLGAIGPDRPAGLVGHGDHAPAIGVGRHGTQDAVAAKGVEAHLTTGELPDNVPEGREVKAVEVAAGLGQGHGVTA